MVLQEEADVAGETITVRIVVIAAIADQDADVVAEVIAVWTLYALVVSFGLANCSKIGHCSPQRRILFDASFIF